MPVLSSYVGDHAALPRMSANADFSTLLMCVASGKKSIEQLRPSAPRQTSALELLEAYSFRILLVYRCALYYGMLILSRALGACPTPPGLMIARACEKFQTTPTLGQTAPIFERSTLLRLDFLYKRTNGKSSRADLAATLSHVGA